MWWVTLVLPVATILAVSVIQPIVDLKITKAQQDLLALQSALGDHKTKRGALPGEQDGLAALVGVSLGRIPVDCADYGVNCPQRRADFCCGQRYSLQLQV
jgi:hypothetical protein